MNVALFGAAGAIGRVLTPELVARGHHVRVVGRDAERLRRAFGSQAEIVAADLSDPAQARAAAEGMDAVVYLVGLPYPEFARHPQLTKIALEAARAAGVTRFVHVSTVYPFGRPRTPLVAETHPREPHTRKGAYRKAQEDLVLAANDPRGLRTLVVRLPDFYGPAVELSFAGAIFTAARNGKRANVVGPIDTEHEWWFIPDSAPLIADLLERDDAFGTDYNVAGERATTRRVAELAYAHAGRKPSLMVATKPLIWVLGRFDPIMRELYEMTYLWQTPVLLDDRKLRTVLGTIHRTPLSEGVARTVDAA